MFSLEAQEQSCNPYSGATAPSAGRQRDAGARSLRQPPSAWPQLDTLAQRHLSAGSLAAASGRTQGATAPCLGGLGAAGAGKDAEPVAAIAYPLLKIGVVRGAGARLRPRKRRYLHIHASKGLGRGFGGPSQKGLRTMNVA